MAVIMSPQVRKMSGFEWNKKKEKAALSLAQGDTQKEAADMARVSDRTIRRWLEHPDFSAEVDRLTHMVGMANRAERLRVAMRVVKGRVENSHYPISEKDLLDWLKYIQSETDGVQLDLTALLAAHSELA
jgi:hypothetical protein